MTQRQLRSGPLPAAQRPSIAPGLRYRLGRRKDGRVVEYITRLTDDLADVLLGLGAELSRALAQADLVDRLPDYVDEFFQRSNAANKFAQALRANMQPAVLEFADAIMRAFDPILRVTQVSQRASDWVDGWAGELGELMRLDTHSPIQAALKRALESGKGVEYARRLIQDDYAFSYERARRTALTELLTAYSVAAEEAYMQSDACTGMVWAHTFGARSKPRRNHVAMDGQRRDKAGTFILYGADGGVYRPKYPRDVSLPASERVNCHCLLEPELDTAVFDTPADTRRAVQQQLLSEANRRYVEDLNRKGAEAGWKRHYAALGTDYSTLPPTRTTR